MATKGVLFVDAHVEDHQYFLKHISPSYQAVVLNCIEDGVSQITRYLTQYSKLESIHIVAHGQDGGLQLGASLLSLETLEQVQSSILGWGRSLVQGAGINLYSCFVGRGDRGRAFVNQLKALTGAEVAASSAPVGHAARGGSWDLDVRTGAIAASPALSPTALANYPGLLARAIPNPMYGVRNNGANAELFIIDLATGSSQKIATIPNLETFAMARESESGRVYFIERGSDSNVVYFDPFDGSTATLANTTGVNIGGNSFLKMAQQQGTNRIFAMEGQNPDLYIINIDPDNPTAGGNAINPAGYTITGGGFQAGSGDIAFDPTDSNRLFVTVAQTGTPTGFHELYAVDVSTVTAPVATLVGIVRDSAGTSLNTTNAGSLAFGQDGKLYLTSANKLYQVDTSTAVATLVGDLVDEDTGSTLTFTDFATLPALAPNIDIQVTKSDGLNAIRPGDPIEYIITVTNNSNFDVFDLKLEDTVSSSISNVRFTAAIASGGGSFPVSSGSGNAIDLTFQLNAKSVARVVVRGTVSSSLPVGSEISNTASIELPPGLPDPNPGNNTSTDRTTISRKRTDDDTDDRPTPPDGGDDGCARGVTLTGSDRRDRLTGGDDRDTLRGLANNDVLRGEGCNDVLDGGTGNDRLFGGSEQDTLQGRQEDDLLVGGSGSDRLNGGLGNDIIRGSSGADEIIGRQGNDDLDGGAGNDTIQGLDDNDRAFGSGGSDLITGGNGNDVLRGGDGDDQISGERDNDRISGGAGDDILRGGLGADQIRGDAGSDDIQGSRGDDYMDGGLGEDRLLGQLGNDVMLGREGNDYLEGGEDDDVLNGGSGSDRIFAGTGNDRMTGGEGDDRVYGGDGNDNILGAEGVDILVGEAGDDLMFGGDGRDFIIGGTGNDTLWGGADSDTFIYTAPSRIDKTDIIKDFEVGIDTIDLTRLFTPDLFTRTDRFNAYVRVIQSTQGAIVRFDGNGDGGPGRPEPFDQDLAILEGVQAVSVTASSFIV